MLLYFVAINQVELSPIFKMSLKKKGKGFCTLSDYVKCKKSGRDSQIVVASLCLLLWLFCFVCFLLNLRRQHNWSVAIDEHFSLVFKVFTLPFERLQSAKVCSLNKCKLSQLAAGSADKEMWFWRFASMLRILRNRVWITSLMWRSLIWSWRRREYIDLKILCGLDRAK